MKRVLVTGGAGFIGSNFARYLQEKHPDYHVTVLDCLSYAGNIDNLKDLTENPNFFFYHGDIRDKNVVNNLVFNCDSIVHFAAETHVDRSIIDADSFISTDVYGTYVLLEAARSYGIEKFVHISTDEVYGEAPDRPSVEEDALNPKSPYAASKTGADRLAFSYFTTYNVPVVISRCANNYGPYQYPEKLIPLFVSNALEDKQLPAYGTGKNTRTWIHVLDHCSAIDMLLHGPDAANGHAFNISSREEFSVLDISNIILKTLKKPPSLIQFVKDRPGHVVRHAVDPSKMEKMFGWKSKIKFEEGIAETIKWYSDNRDWWTKIKDRQKEYKDFQKKWYEER
ncbi:MAG: dTDP-glucose 4,6-dehydratase [Candidatus Saganbacteria bacterium]|nr:dTDP-glucose 4,6-dehydratase [Candidatus Saganbacteria bacterium]